MNIFITGIAGFIGFHLARALKKRGNLVVGCDSFNNYYDPALKKDRAKQLSQEKITVLDSDIRNPPLLEKLMIDHEFTRVVHLAAQPGVRHGIRHPESYVQSNLDGFVQVIEVCRRHPSVKLIYASSSSVYGLNQKVPFAETDPTDNPCSLYGATKKSNEVIAASYHHMFGIPVTGLRFFSVYGPWGRPDLAYFSFANAISAGRPLQVYNQGQMKRDFTYIDDIVNGTIAAIDLGADHEIFNLGNSHPEDVLNLIALLEKQLGKPAIKELLPMQPGDVPTTYADISKSRKILGFKPQVSLEQGIERFIDWYRNYYLK
jgi:UDP-glucuronate 4-epimerase